MLNRRQFLAGSLATAAFPLFSQPAPSDADFSFPLLGDIHYDRLDDHDLDWLKKDHPNDVRQVENYSRITSEIVSPLLTEVSALAAASRTPVPFIAQIGDLVEGLCGSPALARKQAVEALAAVAAANFNRPFLITKGNHDVTGPGAREIYNDVILNSFINQPACAHQSKASFAIDHPLALIAFFDCYDANDSLAWLSNLVTNHLNDRRLIVLTHMPAVPYTPRLWHVFEKSDKRSQFLNLLGQHRAIVLNGHLHKYGLLARNTDNNGRFVQLSVSSVIPSKNAQPKQLLEGKDHYGPALLELEKDFSPTTADQRAAYLKSEAPFISHYDYADTAGYAMLHVTPKAITADVYTAVGNQLWRTVDLTALLTA